MFPSLADTSTHAVPGTMPKGSSNGAMTGSNANLNRSLSLGPPQAATPVASTGTTHARARPRMP